MLGWRGKRSNGSQPRNEGGSRLSKIGISGISRSHPRMAFGSKVRGCLPFDSAQADRLPSLLGQVGVG